MDAMEALLSRRSIRKYEAKSISSGLINDILRAAMSAPSAGNQQPWRFVILRERPVLDSIPEIHPHSLMIREAPVAIVICGDESAEAHKGYWPQDCAAATENLLLAAHALGLGGVWLGVYPREERIVGLRKLLNLPHYIVPFAIVPIGFPAEKKPPPGRFDPEKIHYDAW